MPQKKVVQDIVPSKRRSIREVTLDDKPSPRSARAGAAPDTEDRGVRVPIHLERAARARQSARQADEPEEPSERPPRRGKPERIMRAKRPPRRGRWILFLAVLVCLLAGGWGISIYFAHATVSITPRSETVPIDGIFAASTGAESPDLAFQEVSTTSSADLTVPATAGPVVQTYATGIATLINASSATAQTIVVNTRLSDDRGLVYKTAKTVVIPAVTTSGGKTVAGTVDVKITAASPGASYNSSLADLDGDLSIVAYQGEAKASIFYGREKTDITGGSSGPSTVVAPATMTSAAATLSSRLTSSLKAALQSQASSDFIIYPSSISLVLSSTTASTLSSTTADVTMYGTARGIMFKRTDLENALVGQEISAFPANNYQVNGLDSLDFALATSSSVSASSIKFSLDGVLDIVGTVDPAAIRSSLLGLPISETTAALSHYNSVITAASVTMTPFWVRTVPSSPDRISVTIQGGH